MTDKNRGAVSLDINVRDDSNPGAFHGEMEFAQWFTRLFGDRFICTKGLGWLEWDGARWDEASTGATSRAVKAIVKTELDKLSKITDQLKRKARFTQIQRIESSRGIEGVLKLARAFLPCATDDKALDCYPDLLNTASGVLELETGNITESNPALLLTKVTKAKLNPDTVSKVFDDFIERVLPDPETRAFVQRQLGSALLGEVRDHNLFIWTGEGRNGKGTLRDAVVAALGDYAIEISANILLEQKHSDSNKSELMRLRGARLAFAAETDRGHRFAEATMKKLTGGDPVNAKKLYHDPIEFDPSHTLVMLTNHLPVVSGDDPAVWARMLVVPFNVVIPEEERDTTLPHRLKAESEAVLAWVYLGWVDYQCKGLAPPEAVRQRTAEYQRDSDVLGRFMEARCIVGPHFTVRASELFSTWQSWCALEGTEAGSQTAFGKAMTKRGFASEKKTTGRSLYHGVGLCSDEDEDGSRTPWQRRPA